MHVVKGRCVDRRVHIRRDVVKGRCVDMRVHIRRDVVKGRCVDRRVHIRRDVVKGRCVDRRVHMRRDEYNIGSSLGWPGQHSTYVIFMQDAQIKFLRGTLVFANHVNILVIPNSRSHTHVNTPMLHMPVLTYQRQLVIKQAKNYAIMAH